MKTYEALYENGEVHFKEKPKIRRGRILVTFLDEGGKKGSLTFPTQKLGKLKNISRDKLYEEYLSD